MDEVELIPTDEKSEYFQEHIVGRHGKGSTSMGSKVLDCVDDNYMLNILKQSDKAYQSAINERGNPGCMYFAVKSDKPIGTNAVYPKENIDDSICFSTIRDVGTPHEAKVFVALISEKDMPETNIAHVIMGPYGPTGKAGIYTMIFGDVGMPMPKTIDENTPPEQVKFNDECKKYWDNHVFLVTPKELEANIDNLKTVGVNTEMQELALKTFKRRGEASPIIKTFIAQPASYAVDLQISSSKFGSSKQYE